MIFPLTRDITRDSVRDLFRPPIFNPLSLDPYYFYNPQDLSSGAVTTWNGRIVGSDNGDVDKNATQSTSADQPTSDGYKVTFADNTDHFDIPSTTQAGWQVVGTSLGTFAYKVNDNAVTELNLLGNLGNASFRKTGDLYGIILLPESATGKDINEAKKLLTDRGASVSATGSVRDAWFDRSDIVQFDGGDMSGVTSVFGAWFDCSSLTSFSSELPSATDVYNAWYDCSSLTSFSSELPLVTVASNGWRNCTSLTSFSTELPLAINVSYAWNGCTSLTSFSSDLSSVNNASNAWRGCSSLESFNTELPSATNVSAAWYQIYSLTDFSVDSLPEVIFADAAWYASQISSFNTSLPKVKSLADAWNSCPYLTDFSADVFANWNPASISSGIFNQTWLNCPLTAQSVENILTSIDSSGKHATSDGTSGATPLGDSGIDIDFNGDPLSAATTAAITSLKSKGWSIFINSVEQ